MDAPRLLLFDVGNTAVKIGLAQPDGAIHAYSFATASLGTADGLGFTVLEVLRFHGLAPEQCQGWVAASVVPRLDRLIREAARRFAGQEALFAPDDLPLPMTNAYARPAEVGADRLVGAYAAMELFPAPAWIVVDFGTATTFDCAVAGTYLGGLICPGLLSSAQALAGGTAKLPQVDFSTVAEALAIGRSTADSLAQGLVHGFAAMVSGLVVQLKTLLPAGARVIAAGGLAPVVARVCPAIDDIRPDLLLDGLRLAYGRGRIPTMHTQPPAG